MKDWATSFSPTSARWTRSSTWFAASRTTTCSTWSARWTRPATGRSSTSSWASPTSPASRSGSTRPRATARSGDAQAKLEQRLLEAVRDALAAGRPARAVVPTEEEAASYRSFNLLTAKPVLYAANVGEDEIASGNPSVEALARHHRQGRRGRRGGHLLRQGRGGAGRARAGGPEGLPRLARRLRVGARSAWLTPPITCSACRATSPPARRKSGPGPSTAGDKAPAAAGVIHSDFEKGFIRAETVAYDDFVRVGGWKPRARAGPLPRRGQGVRRAGRRRAAVPLQLVIRIAACARGPAPHRGHAGRSRPDGARIHQRHLEGAGGGSGLRRHAGTRRRCRGQHRRCTAVWTRPC